MEVVHLRGRVCSAGFAKLLTSLEDLCTRLMVPMKFAARSTKGDPKVTSGTETHSAKLNEAKKIVRKPHIDQNYLPKNHAVKMLCHSPYKQMQQTPPAMQISTVNADDHVCRKSYGRNLKKTFYGLLHALIMLKPVSPRPNRLCCHGRIKGM